MRQYIIRRLLVSVLVLIGVSILLYTVVRMMPADYITLATSTAQKITTEQKEHLAELYGVNDSFVTGYLKWLKGAVRLDLGVSLKWARPVTEIIKEKAPVTFLLSFISLIFELLISIPLGIIAARKRNTKTDYAITLFVFLGISMPTFFFASIMKRVFGFYGLNWFPVAGMLNPKVLYKSFTFAKFVDYFKHFFMPIVVHVMIYCGTWLRYIRGNMIEALGSDYVRTARAKGVPERTVVYSHAFRNTLIPIITMLGAQLPALFSGAIIMEQLFAIEGTGNLAFMASQLGDMPYLMGFNMMLAVFTVIGFLISDILYAVADPRIRLS